MSYHGDNPHVSAGDWLTNMARRNPEALLVLAAGAALLLRGGIRSRNGDMGAHRGSSAEFYRDSIYNDGQAAWEEQRRQSHGVRGKLSEAAEAAGEYAAEAKDRVVEAAEAVAETAGSYASAAAEYADAGRRRVTREAYRAGRQAYRAGTQAGHMLHEQPLAVAALGLAAGAGVAALLPRMEMEERALRPARDALAGAADRVVQSAKEAATDAGRRLQEKAVDLGTQALKETAREAAQSFSSSTASSKPGDANAGRTGTSGGGAT